MTGSIGKKAEDVAAAYLEKYGMVILAKNVMYPFGELDLVALDKKVLVFIEVKYRYSLAFGFPLEAVSRAKQKKIILAAKAYLQKRKCEEPRCRFDVVSLWGDLKNPVIDHIEDAFWVEDY
jgi:putative endonuclease